MKYYKCIKEVIGFNEMPINTFVSFAFGTVTSNRNHYPNFFLGGIYKSAYYTDKYVVDGIGTTWSIETVQEYLEEIEIKLEKEVEDLIKNHNKDILVEPYKIENGEIEYIITCSAKKKNGKNVSIQCFSISQYLGVITCFERLRTLNGNYLLIERCLNQLYRKRVNHITYSYG